MKNQKKSEKSSAKFNKILKLRAVQRLEIRIEKKPGKTVNGGISKNVETNMITYKYVAIKIGVDLAENEFSKVSRKLSVRAGPN